MMKNTGSYPVGSVNAKSDNTQGTQGHTVTCEVSGSSARAGDNVLPVVLVPLTRGWSNEGGVEVPVYLMLVPALVVCQR